MTKVASTDHPAIQTRELTKKYGAFTALDRLTISVNRGQILGFIGPNGAGKTTLIRILVGLARPTSGSATIAGSDCVADARRIRNLVGYMPDVFGSYDNMRVHEYLDFFGAAFKIPRRERVKRIETVMDITGSTYMRDRYVESLSHGMKQRLGIARTLLHDPQVLFLDEPANGLDPQARIEMRELLLRLAQMGKTLFVTSHILPELSRICDVVAIVAQGKLRAFGTLDQIMQRLGHRRMIEIELTNASQLSKLAGLAQSYIEPGAEVNASPQEAILRFQTAADDQRLATLLSMAVQQGIPILQFREVQMDLEDAFLEVTRGERAPATPAASRTGSRAKPTEAR
ncbi:MAG: ABC transporter ATP-binding protein [Planctomycetota bacterium]|nr:ABC transporter ATP-binding protein [Planctomycetota bacterium]